MPDDPNADRESDRQPMRTGSAVTGPDWIIPILSLMFAAYYLWSIAEMRWDAKISSFFVAVILCVLIAGFVIRTVIGLSRGALHIDFSGWRSNLGGLYRQAILFALIVAFIALIPSLGFTITVFVFLLLSFFGISRMAPLRATFVAGVVAIGGYLLFIVALRTNFPDGAFERLASSLASIM